MSLLLDPREPVEHRIKDVVFLIRCFTSRQSAAFLKSVLPLRSMLAAADEESHLTPEMVDHLEEVVRMGVCGWKADAGSVQTFPDYELLPDDALDRIPVQAWTDLYHAISEVNTVTEEEAKN